MCDDAKDSGDSDEPMAERKTPDDATLLDVLIDGFEKNELMDGFHWRQLPMSDEGAAARKFSSLVDEARQWKGSPTRVEETPGGTTSGRGRAIRWARCSTGSRKTGARDRSPSAVAGRLSRLGLERRSGPVR